MIEVPDSALDQSVNVVKNSPFPFSTNDVIYISLSPKDEIAASTNCFTFSVFISYSYNPKVV